MFDVETLTALDAEHVRAQTQAGAIDSSQPILSTRQIARSAIKRLFDIIISLGLLLLFSPTILAAIFCIKMDSPGPVLFRQRRTGFNGEPFTIFKFRTMLVQDDDATTIMQASQNDPRVTPLGVILRRTSIDELPQLINVLRGDMSIVGPRPHAIAHDMYFGQLVPHYPLRFRVRPGLTGLAQVSGLRGETPTVADMARRIDVDNSYIDNWRLSLDLAILLSTAKLFVLSDKRAY